MVLLKSLLQNLIMYMYDPPNKNTFNSVEGNSVAVCVCICVPTFGPINLFLQIDHIAATYKFLKIALT